MSRNYPKLIFFFWRSNHGTPFLTIQHHIAWKGLHISKVHYLFVFTSQTNKSVLNWVVLILIKQNIILKTRNQDFPPSKIEYVITLLKWLVRLILLLFLVVYRSTFKVVLTIFRILICRSHFSLSRFYPIILTLPWLLKFVEHLFLEHFLFLWINLFCSIADVV